MRKPDVITAESWKNLKLKEKAFVVLLFKHKYSEKEMMERLFIDSPRTFRAIRLRVLEKIEVCC